MDVAETTPYSYKKMLLDKQAVSQTEYYNEDPPNHQNDKGKIIEGSVALSQEDKNRMYQPWRFSVIIKLILIDLGWDFFIVKFSLEENMAKALHLRPWFVSGNFISVRIWEPKFVPQEATLSSTAMWIRLPQLPTEFYDKEILKKVGRKLGKLLKIDSCTSFMLRGRYARICIQVPLETQ
nr:uncharacterized protein LOC117273670 [Nicotiana tomentosiformis]